MVAAFVATSLLRDFERRTDELVFSRLASPAHAARCALHRVDAGRVRVLCCCGDWHGRRQLHAMARSRTHRSILSVGVSLWTVRPRVSDLHSHRRRAVRCREPHETVGGRLRCARGAAGRVLQRDDDADGPREPNGGGATGSVRVVCVPSSDQVLDSRRTEHDAAECWRRDVVESEPLAARGVRRTCSWRSRVSDTSVPSGRSRTAAPAAWSSASDRPRRVRLRVRPAFTASTVWAQLWSQYRVEIRGILKSMPFVLDCRVWPDQRAHQHRVPRSDDGHACLARHAPDAARHQRRLRVPRELRAAVLRGRSGVADARSLDRRDARRSSRYRHWVPLTAKVLALWTAVAVFLTAGALGLVGYQLSKGYTHLEPGLYVQGLIIEAVPFLLSAVLAVFLQVVVNQKYVGYLAAGSLHCQQRCVDGAAFRSPSLSIWHGTRRPLFGHERLGTEPAGCALVPDVLVVHRGMSVRRCVSRLGAWQRIDVAGPRAHRGVALTRTRGIGAGCVDRRCGRGRRVRLLQHQHPQRVPSFQRRGAQVRRVRDEIRQVPAPAAASNHGVAVVD